MGPLRSSKVHTAQTHMLLALFSHFPTPCLGIINLGGHNFSPALLPAAQLWLVGFFAPHVCLRLGGFIIWPESSVAYTVSAPAGR